MSYYPDMGQKSGIVAGEHVRAVGWLHPDHLYTTGKVPPEFVIRLAEFVNQSDGSADALYFGAYAGVHTCEFCDNAHGLNNFGVLGDDVLYVAPEMILHYVHEHAYAPPAEFIVAVLRSPLPVSEEYQVLAEPYWQIHRERVERFTRDA